MSAICETRSTVKSNAACLAELKTLLANLDVTTLNECLDQIKDLVCDPDWVAPDCLAEEATATEMIVEGDQTSSYQAGDNFTVFNDTGDAIGTAAVVNSTFDAATNQTTVQYNNLQSTTATPVAIAQVKAVKKRVAVVNEEKR